MPEPAGVRGHLQRRLRRERRLPVHQRTSAVSTSSALFVVGGQSGFVILSEVQRFDFGAGTWSKTGPKLTHAHEDLAAAVDACAPGSPAGWVASP